MPAKSKAQQRAAGAALAAKRGRGKARGAAKQMAGSMSEEQLTEFAVRPRKKRKVKPKPAASKRSPKRRSARGFSYLQD